MTILIYVAMFALGLLIGVVLTKRFARRTASGTIFVTHDEEKTLYSLELSDYPESLEFKKVVVFKVESPPASRE